MSALPDPRDMAELFRRLRTGEAAAFGEIAARLWECLRPAARRRLEREPELSAIYNEEDALQSGLNAMWAGLLAGTIAPPDGVDGFLRMARTIISRRIVARARAERVDKRNPTPHRETAWRTGPLDWLIPDTANVFQLASRSHEAEVIAEDVTRWLLSLLGWQLREVAEDRFLEARTLKEIAAKRGKSSRTIVRILQDIMIVWRDAVRRLDS